MSSAVSCDQRIYQTKAPSHRHTFVQVRLVEVVRPWNVHIIQTRNIPVADKVLKQLYLTQRSLRQDLLAEDIGDLLDSDALARLIVRCGADNAVGTLSKLFGHGVAFVDDKVLVEDFEDLAALQVAHADGVEVGCCSSLSR
jgi:hypothetical protein